MTTTTGHTKGFIRYLRNNRAVSALEYAILIGIIALVTSAAIVAFAPNITKAVKAVGDKVGAATVNTGVN